MKTTLFEAAESASVLDKLSGQMFDGRLSLKICDNLDLITKKGSFLDKEIRKIVEHYGAEAFDPGNNDFRLIVKNDDGTVNEEKTQEFVDKVVELRKTEIDLDIVPFTMEDMEKVSLQPSEMFRIRWMIDRDS